MTMENLAVKHQDLPTNWGEREKLRSKGQFWTPAWVAKAMVAYVAKDTDLVFDPAAGEGIFYQVLCELFPETNYLGIDIDGDVLDIIPSASTVHVEKRDFVKNPPERKFKGIVSNPPYIRHHRIDKKTKHFLKKLTARITGFTIDGRAGFHIYFLLQALNLLEKDGRLAFIMPADTCEGVFSEKLWKWIAEKYCLECVVTFSEEATPFPSVDTNAIIFFIKNQPPKEEIAWVKVTEPSHDFQYFVESNFKKTDAETIEVSRRDLKEALNTGLSRPAHLKKVSKYCLSDFASVMRGIATGATEFFFLTEEQIKANGLSFDFFLRSVGRTRDVQSDQLTLADLEALEKSGRPTWLLSIGQPYDTLPAAMKTYLQKGLELGFPERALIKPRNPWYKTEKRAIPEMLFAYLGRRNTRFIKNEAGVVPLHCLHCVYTYSKASKQVENLWKVLNHPDTLANLSYVSKSYGSGALKAEPQNLKNLSLPEHLVKHFGLIPKAPAEPSAQLILFR